MRKVTQSKSIDQACGTDATSQPAGGIRMMREPDVIATVGLSRSRIRYLESQKEFPSRIKLAARSVAWLEHEVVAWMQQRVAASRKSAA